MTEASLQSVPLNKLVLSDTPAQRERRRHFDAPALIELATSIKEVGLLQPIVVRPFKQTDSFEIVCGERRFKAAEKAGLRDIIATVRELSDRQVIEVQLVENLQREGLHELAEAEGYESLQRDYGFSVDDLVAKLGKSKAYVYARLKLLALCKKARAAFYSGKLTASVALLLARVPVESLQEEALEELLNGRFGDGARDEPMSTREAAEHIQDNYMLALADAPFPTGDADLVAKAGTCATCPKNTISQPELFGDMPKGNGKGKSAGVCTDALCFNSKRQAFAERVVSQARTSGKKVIEGPAAKKLAPYGTHNLQGGYVSLDDKCYQDSKHRTYRQLLEPGQETAVLVAPLRHPKEQDSVGVVEVAQLKDFKKIKPERDQGDNGWRKRQVNEAKKRKVEMAFRLALYSEIRPKLSRELDHNVLLEVTKAMVQRLGAEHFPAMAPWHDLNAKLSGSAIRTALLKRLEKYATTDLAVVLQDCVYCEELQIMWGGNEKPKRLLELARGFNIQVEPIRKELTAGGEKPKAKKPAVPKRKK